MAKSNYAQIKGLLDKRAEFQGNSLSAKWFFTHDLMHSEVPRGLLDSEESSVLFEAEEWALRSGLHLYVVFSYATPIAWALDVSGPAYVTEQKWSVTTSKGQHLCRVHLLTDYDRAALEAVPA